MVQWTDKLDSKFLKVTLKLISPSIPRETWGKVAAIMGEDFTLEACRLHYAKLQKDEDCDVATPDVAVTPKAASTPRKRKAATNPDETPSKSNKSSNKKKAAATPVKREDAEEGDSVADATTVAPGDTEDTDKTD